jgi:hypothetical protein
MATEAFINGQATAAPPSRRQVFISYSHEPPENAAFVRNLAGRLTVAGFSVWLDEEQIAGGDNFHQEILAAARESEVAVFVATQRWAERPWTQHEVDLFGERLAHKDGVRLVVLAREQVDTSDLGPYLARLHRVDWPDDEAEPDARFWQVYCGIAVVRPGPRDRWAENGRAIAEGVTTPRLVAGVAAPTPTPKPSVRSPKTDAETKLPCEGRPVDIVPGEDGIFVVTDLDEWVGISPNGVLPPVPRLSNPTAYLGDSGEGLLVATCDQMLARFGDGAWEFRRLPSPALSLCAGADGVYIGTAAGTILHLDHGRIEPLCQLRDPVIALAAAGEDGLLIVGAQGLFGKVSLAKESRGALTWLDGGLLGRPLGVFPAAESEQVGIVGATRFGVIDPATGSVTACPTTIEQGIRAVTFLGPQRWPYAVLTDANELHLVSAALDGLKVAPLPPGAVAKGCCGIVGRGLAAAWTQEGRLYRMTAMDQPPECLVDGKVALAAPMIARPAIAAILWDEAGGAALRMIEG